jgi:glycosyltransferase involved in cell wall biosynthesis
MVKPKILVCLTYYLPNISGVTQYASILADSLTKRNYEVKILSSRFRKELKSEKNIERVDGFQIGKGFIMPMYWWKSLVAVKETDIVNCHLPSVESFWPALWAKIFHKKLIITHHCEFNFTGTLNNKVISVATYPLHFLVYLMADTIVSYTEDYAKTSVFLRFFKKKIKYILPPIKISPTPLFDKRGKNIFGIDNNEKIVGFVGRIGWEKGLEYLIEAMKNIKAKLVLVGPYKEVVGDKTYEKLKNIIDKKIVFYGPMAHENLKAFYEKCDCLVLPSINNLETFGIVQAEAMVCGTPVVASDLPGVRVPVQMTGMGEICKIKDSEDLAKKIDIVLKNGKKYYQKRARNLDKFDYKKTANEYEKLFNEFFEISKLEDGRKQ